MRTIMKRVLAISVVAAALLAGPGAKAADVIDCERMSVTAIIECESKPGNGDVLVIDWKIPGFQCEVWAVVDDISTDTNPAVVNVTILRAINCPPGLFARNSQTVLAVRW